MTVLSPFVALLRHCLPFASGAADFQWTQTEQPHASRRSAILKAHPEIKQVA